MENVESQVAKALTPAVGPKLDLRDSLESWLEATNNLDLHDLNLALMSATEPHDGDATADTVARAQSILLQGESDLALAELTAVGLVELPLRAQLNRQTIVVAACLAAHGDPDAYGRLLSIAPAAGPLSYYLLGASADKRDDWLVGHQAWTTLIEKYGILTEYTFTRWAAARIAARSRLSRAESAQMLFDLAQAYSRLPHDIELRPQPALEVADRLEHLGDIPGSRLFLYSISRLQPPVEVIEQRAKRLAPSMTAYRWQAGMALLLGIAAIPLGLLGVLFIMVGRVVWNRKRNLPGLDGPDTYVWRCLSGQQYNKDLDKTEDLGRDVRALAVLGLVIALCLGLALSIFATNLVVSLTGSQGVEEVNPALIVFTWVIGCLVTPALLVSLAGVLKRKFQRERTRWRRRRERAARHTRLSQCHCLQTQVLTDEFALEYASLHLVAVPATDNVNRLRSALGPGAMLGACPNTRVVWLGYGLGPKEPGWLLRGAVPLAQPVDSEAEPGTGMYL
jgi:hypothetical protein